MVGSYCMRVNYNLTQEEIAAMASIPTAIDEPEVAALRATTYTTLDGRRLDLRTLTEEERSYLARCYAAYVQGMAWEQFGHLATGAQHPVLRATDGVVTPDAWHHRLYQATSDLEDRLGIAQGELAADPGTSTALDPFAEAAA